MINIMYLVLMALLALEIPDTVLNAFVVVNKGLMATNKNFDQKNQASFNQFAFAMKVNPVETKPLYDKAKLIKGWSANLCAFIDSMKHVLIAEEQHVPMKIADTTHLSIVKNLGDEDIPTHFMVNDAAAENGSKGEAHVLKLKMAEYRRDAINLIKEVNPKLNSAADSSGLNIGLLTGDEYSKVEGRMVPWEVFNFYATPLAATITSLSHIQNDVKNTEASIVQYLLGKIGQQDFKVSGFEPEVIPATNYVMVGDSFRAKVFLSAVSNSQKPIIAVGDYDSNGIKTGSDTSAVSILGGTGYYTARADQEGPKTVYGVIRVKDPQGTYKSYPFHTSYLVARPSVVISPTKMNVFYIGVPNPVAISAAGFADKDIRPVFEGPGSIYPAPGGHGNYIVKVMRGAGTTCKIGVSGQMPDGSRKTFPPQVFRIKAVPDPVCYVLADKGDVNMAKVELTLIKNVTAKMENFDFDLPYTVTSFSMVFTANGLTKTLRSNSAGLTGEMKDALRRIPPGNLVEFGNVHCVSAAGPKVITGVTITVQ